MSKLASFINKHKEEIRIHYPSFYKEDKRMFCSRFHAMVDYHSNPIFIVYKNEIVFTDKKEKIFETTNVVYIIKSIIDQDLNFQKEGFWENLSQYARL